MKHLIIVCPNCFASPHSAASVIKDIEAYFQRTAKDNYHIHVSRFARDAGNIIAEYAGATEDIVRVYAVGGDAVLHDCLNGVVPLPNTQLAAVPYGHGQSNDFVRNFGEDAPVVFRDIEKQATAGVIPTDVIRVGNGYTLTFCSIGLSAATYSKYYKFSEMHPWLARKLRKHMIVSFMPFAMADGKVLNRKYELYIDGARVRGAFLGFAFASGSRSAVNKTPFPMAHPTSGKLEIITLNPSLSPLGLKQMDRYVKGNYHMHPRAFKHVSAHEVLVKADGPMYINIDNEIYYDTKVHAKILPGAVNFVVPDGFSYERGGVANAAK